jgi:hypothetical protein
VTQFNFVKQTVWITSFYKMSILNAKSFKTNEDLRKFPPKIRGCYFEDEKKLKFFKIYTKNNCDLECMTNYNKEFCGCVHFSMPRTENTRICELKDGNCYFNAINFWMQNSSAKFPCDCFPSCNYLKYSIKNSYSITSEKSVFKWIQNYFQFASWEFWDWRTGELCGLQLGELHCRFGWDHWIIPWIFNFIANWTDFWILWKFI